MPNFGLALLASHNHYYIESHRQMFEFVCPDEKICRSVHPDLFCFCDGRFSVSEILISSGFDFHKDDCPFGIGHNQVYLACFAEKVPHKQLIAFVFKEFFTELLSGSAEQTRFFEQFFPFIVFGAQFYAPVVCSVRL